MAERVPAALRQQLITLAHGRCEYCLFPDALAIYPHEPNHIVAIQHRGTTSIDNLALACVACNRHKGPNPGSFDPVTGNLTRFFHPRRDRWIDHFSFIDGRIEPLTAIGRVTADILQFNTRNRIAERRLAAALHLIDIP